MAEEKKEKSPARAVLSGEKPAVKKEKPAKKSEKKSEKKAAKRKFAHSHIEHHSDGSHTVRHTPVNGGDEVSYAAPDLNAVTQGLQNNLGNEEGEPSEPSAEPASSEMGA